MQTCMHVLQSGSVDVDSFNTVLNIFCNFCEKTEAVAKNREAVATVFYQLLSVCQKIYEIDSPEKLQQDIKTKILTSFSNIEHLYKEASADIKQLSYVRTIWFLSELKAKSLENRVADISQELLQESASDLLDVLDDIRFIFDIADNGHILFPINKVIASVISGNDFMSFRNGIKTKDIQILQLAVRLFKTSSETAVLDTLRKTCHLGFIDYLRATCEIIDTIDFLNYQYNGTMVFYDAINKKVLIRSEVEGYFCQNTRYGHNIELEKDCDNNTIGWYVEYPLEPNDKLIDFSYLMEDEDKRVNFLKLIYDEGFFNIFLQKAIVMKGDGNLVPVNPYCYQDENIIKGKLKDRKGKKARKDQLRDLIQEYRVCSVKSNVMNRLSFGLCLLLLSIKNVGVESLGLTHLNEDSWYQEQVINNWLSNNDVTEDHLLELLNDWYSQLAYCDRNKNFNREPVKALDFFPLKQDLNCVYYKIFPSLYEDERVFCGNVIEESEHYCIEVIERDTVSSDYQRSIGNKNISVSVKSIVDEESYYNWQMMEGSKVYFLYSPVNRSGHVIRPEIMKVLSGLEWIQMTSFPHDVGILITDIEYEEVAKRMLLYKEAFKDISRQTRICKPEDIESQIYLRLLHNLIWSRVTKENKDDYFDVICKHQIADFSEIEKDESFLRMNDATLYIPKDDINQGSVLSDLYNKRLRDNIERDERPLYQENLEKSNSGCYTINGRKIEQILLLTDNFVNGSSTKFALSAYLGINTSNSRVKESIETMQHFYCDGKEVTVPEIIRRNDGIPISVYGFYGTDEGCAKIDSFLEKYGYNYTATSYNKKLTIKAGTTISQAETVWGDKKGELDDSDHYLFIREYNMPRKTVFPHGMSGNPQYVICLFVRRPERNEKRKYRG